MELLEINKMTNLDIANIAQQIQDKSAPNVSVHVEFSLNKKYCSPWIISINMWSYSGRNILEQISFDSSNHRMMMLAKHGYNFK